MAAEIPPPIIVKYELANTTGRWLLVGDYHEVISHHETRDAAATQMATIGNAGPDGLAETRWAIVRIVAPGETLRGELAQYLARETKDGEVDALLAQIFG